MYNLSDTRAIETRDENGEVVVVIKDLTNGNFVEIPPARWASFLLLQGDIDDAVKQLQDKQYVKYVQHIGGAWYVSVTTGFRCVDIRRFYSKNGEIKPTKQGLALRLAEWTTLLDLLPLLMSFEPDLLVACPCSMRLDHLENPSVVQGCRECSPFGTSA